MLHIAKVAGLVTVQDLGWDSGRAMGLPQSGAMDPNALRLGNALVGNGDGEAGLEVALGSVVITLAEKRRVAVTGSAGGVLDDVAVPPNTTLLLGPGQPLTLSPGQGGRFGYLAIAGGIATPPMLGRRATYLPTGLGGHQGRRLMAGDALPLGTVWSGPKVGTAARPPEETSEPIRVVLGPQAHLFDSDTLARFEEAEFVVSPTSDRMGTRLTGPSIAPRTKAALPSEGTCLGAIQVPDDGQPVVLLADGPTVGGYPKIAALISADLARLVQTRTGRPVRFQTVSIERAAEARTAWVAAWGRVLATVRAARE